MATGISGLISLLLIAGINPSDIYAQGTNETEVYGTSPVSEQTTVIVPLGYSGATSGVGYELSEVIVSPSATVVCDNQDNALHTATSGVSPDPESKFDTGIVGANQQSHPVTMPTEPGEYPYFCTFQPFLTGTVIVQ